MSSLSTKCPGFRPIIVVEVLWHIIRKAVMRVVRMDVEAASGSCLICVGLDGEIEATVHESVSLQWMHEMCSTTWTGTVDLHIMSFIGPALMTILANTLLPIYMDKHANGLTIPGHSRDSAPFGSSWEGRPRDVHFSHPWMTILTQLNARSWHTQQDRRDGADNSFLKCWFVLWGIKQHNNPNCHPSIFDPIATSIKGKAIKFFVWNSKCETQITETN